MMYVDVDGCMWMYVWMYKMCGVIEEVGREAGGGSREALMYEANLPFS